MHRSFSALCLAAACLCTEARAVIVYGHANNSAAITSDPGAGLPWSNVGRVWDTSNGNPRGTAVYIGDRWMLTAGHVVVGAGQSVSFDGVTNFSVESGSITSFEPTDVKLFRLASEPSGMAPVTIDSRPINQAGGFSVLMGYGVGRQGSIPVNTSEVTWGGNSTIAKRWGVNSIAKLENISYPFFSQNYAYTSLVSILGDTSGEFEAGLGVYDSGTPLFQSVSGSWVLVGIATVVETDGVSVFGADNHLLAQPPRGDANFFAPLSTIDEDIYATIPESGAVAAVLGLTALALAGLRSRRENTR